MNDERLLLRAAGARWRDRVLADPGCARVTDLRVEHGDEVLLDHSTTGGRAQDLFSVTKTVVALLAGQALDDGLLPPLGTRVRDCPGMAPYAGLGEQRLVDLLALTRGAAVGGSLDLDVVALTEGSWAALFAGAAQEVEPGREFRYDNGAAQLLAEALERAVLPALGRQPGGLAAYARDRLFGPLGIDADWRRDPTGVPTGPAHLRLSAAHLARLGRLLVTDGVHDGRRVLPAGWAAAMADPVTAGGPPEHRPYGLGLWVEDDGTAFGAGWAGQLLLVRPRDRVVVVSLSDPGFDYGPPARDAMPEPWTAPLDHLRGTLLPASDH